MLDNKSLTAIFSILAAAIISLTAIFGWIFNIKTLTQFSSNWSSMNINVAIGILLSCISVFFFNVEKSKPIVRVLAIFVFLLGGITLLEHIFNWNAGIDEFFIIDHTEFSFEKAGRMSPLLAVALMLISISLFTHNFTKKLYWHISKITTTLSFFIAFIALIGYSFSSEELYGIKGYVSISFPSALSLALICIGIFFSRRDFGFIKVFYEPTFAAKEGTKAAILSTITFFIICWFAYRGVKLGFFDYQFSLSLIVIAFVVIISLILRRSTKKLNIAEVQSRELTILQSEREHFSRGILSSLVSNIAVIDKEGFIVEVNNAWINFALENNAGSITTMIKGGNYYEICNKAIDQGDEYALNALNGIKALFKKEINIFELQYPCHSPNTKRWFLLRVTLFEGVKNLAVVTHIDITDMVIFQHKLELSEHSLQQVLEHSEEMIWSLDTKHQLVIFNNAFSKEYASVIGSLPIKGIIPYTSLELPIATFLKQKIETCLAGKSLSFEVSYNTNNELKILDLFLYPIYKNDIVEGISCFALNVTTRKKVERALKNSEATLKEAQSIAKIGSWEYNHVKNKLLCSDEIFKLFEVDKSKENSELNNFLDTIHPDDKEKVYCIFNDAANSKIGYTIEHRILLPSGKIKHILSKGKSYFDESGKILKTIGAIQDITERKEIEEKFILSEAKYRSFFNQSANAIFIFDKNGQLLDVNDIAVEMLGYSKSDMLLLTVFDLENDIQNHPIDLSLLIKGETVINERQFKKKDGSIIIVEVHSRKLPDGNSLGIVRDITDKKQAEELLKISEEKHRSMIEKNLAGIYQTSIDGKIISCNLAFANIFGYHPDELFNVNAECLYFSNTDRAAFLTTIRNQKEVTHLEMEMKHKDGHPIFIIENCVLKEDLISGEEIIEGIMIDISGIKKAEQLLITNEKKYRNMMEKAGDSILLINKKGEILEINDAGSQLLGYSREEYLNLTILNFVPKEDLMKNPFQFENLDKGKSVQNFRNLKRNDGSFIIAEINANKIFDNLYMILIRDQTERIKAEKDLEQSYQSVRALSEHLQFIREEERTHIAREIHDELGQQLTVMMMDIAWLDKKINSTEIALKQKVNEMREMLSETVKSVRTISTELRPSVLDDLGLISAIEIHLKEFQKRSGIIVLKQLPENEFNLKDNITIAIFRILQESLTNVSRHSKAKKVSVSLNQIDQKIILTIIDDGKGFSDSVLNDKKTLGVLGMKERASAIGGDYNIKGLPGVGTTIIVNIPILN